MKYILFFLGVVLFQMMGAEGNRRENFKECAKELGITREMMKEARENGNSKPEFRCLSACIMKKTGILEPGNKYNMDKFKEIASKKMGDKAPEVIKGKEECIEAAKSITDECDFVRSVEECMIKKFPEMKRKH